MEEASSTKSTVSLETSSNIKIAIKYSEEKNQFGDIKFYADPEKVTTTYINSNGEESDTIENGIKIIAKLELEP